MFNKGRQISKMKIFRIWKIFNSEILDFEIGHFFTKKISDFGSFFWRLNLDYIDDIRAEKYKQSRF